MMSISQLIKVFLLSVAMCFSFSRAGYSQEPWKTVLVCEAINRGRCDVLKLALDKGLDPNAIGPTGYPLLHIAVAQDQYEIVRMLMQYGANLKRNGCEYLVKTAIYNKNYELAKYLVVSGAIVTRPDYLCCMWEDPLVAAAGEENLDLVVFLIKHHADVNATSLGFKTALHVAASLGNLEMVKYLISVGAIINQRDGYGKTALMYACEKGQPAVVEYLLTKGADTKMQDAFGQSAMTFAEHSSSTSKSQIVTILSEH